MREKLAKRAKLVTRIRSFLDQRGVLEVTTPCITECPVSDPHIESVALGTHSPHYLRTSPESAHKHLLAHGAGDIYELGPVFRSGELGRVHQPEFTMLEWYRTGFDWHNLALEVIELINEVAAGFHAPWPFVFRGYDEIGQSVLGFDLRTADRKTLCNALPQDMDLVGWEDAEIIDYLFSTKIQPSFDPTHITVVHDYPAAQAALAMLCDDQVHAKRFEVFIGPIELANGYEELSDPEEQRQRFANDAQTRQAMGRGLDRLDHRLLAALEKGLPPCSGVALGVDRLVMVILGLHSLEETVGIGASDAMRNKF